MTIANVLFYSGGFATGFATCWVMLGAFFKWGKRPTTCKLNSQEFALISGYQRIKAYRPFDVKEGVNIETWRKARGV